MCARGLGGFILRQQIKVYVWAEMNLIMSQWSQDTSYRELLITTVIIRTLLSQTPLFRRNTHIPTLAEILEMTGTQCFPSALPLSSHVPQRRCHLFMLIDRTSSAEDKNQIGREKRIWRQGSPALPSRLTDRFHKVTKLLIFAAWTNTFPLTRPCNTTHWRPDTGHLKANSSRHKCMSNQPKPFYSPLLPFGCTPTEGRSCLV